MDQKIALAFPGMAAPARRSLAEISEGWSDLTRWAAVARDEGPSDMLNQIAGVSGVGPVAAEALATSSTSRTTFRSSTPCWPSSSASRTWPPP
ncbi:Uncharacterised protein [Brevundimonas diminuta]|uniref:Uncharacterized protein n=1 Tax=Brevundimonas diminuta TaxID=293 RepID=A0A2X1AFS2_BREDI|nr:Uncharacterised protein [Brevundimonas diminuta]